MVILVTLLDRQFLFAGDSSSYALDKYIVRSRISLQRPYVFHIPHHGSKRNLGPNFLTKLCGKIDPKYKDSQKCDRFAIVSLAKEDNEKHPSQLVINALRRRGYITPIIRDKIFHISYISYDSYYFLDFVDEYKYI